MTPSLRNEHPNILFILSDQHRADVMGAAGNDVVVTPHLDRLAAQGLRCTNAWTESPICQPARASLLTGRYPLDHGIIGNFTHDCSPEWDTMPKALQAEGYATASVGKTHYSSWPMGPEGPVDEPPPADEWIGGFGFDHVVEEFDRYVHVGHRDTPYMRFLRDHDALERYRETIKARFRRSDQHWQAATSPLPQELDLTSFLASEAETWLDAQPDDRPWFLQLSFVQPHVPLIGDPIWADHYAGAVIERTAPAIPESDHEGWAGHLKILRGHSRSALLTDEFVLEGARQYYAMVSLIDQKIGALLALLEQKGVMDDTWVIYSSDHGEMLGDHGLMAKMNFYRSSARVPFIVRPPGGTAAVVHDGPVQAFDTVGTILDVVGSPLLDDIPARSVRPLFDDGAEQGAYHRDVAVSTIRFGPQQPTWVAVTDGDWRATYDRHRGDVVELFDLSTDPDETTNRATDPSAASEADRLRALAPVAQSS